MTGVLEVKNLKKSYGDLQALKGISLNIDKGEILALLGPNGAGKTTAIQCISHLIPPSGGEIILQGGSKGSLGLCPQDIIIWDQLTLMEQLLLMGRLNGVPRELVKERSIDLLDRLGLTQKTNRQAKTLSGGMKRRLNVALSLVHDPALWILDEPEAGLDPQSRILVREFILEESARRAVLLTSHNMDEVQRTAQRILLIDQGQILDQGSLKDLLLRHESKDLEELFIKLTGRSLRQ